MLPLLDKFSLLAEFVTEVGLGCFGTFRFRFLGCGGLRDGDVETIGAFSV